MVITFYRVTDDYRKLEKTLGSALGTATGVLHERVNDISLSIKLPSTLYNTVTQSNYVMIDTFQKYYFLRTYDIENDCVIVNLYEDVRMSFAAQIADVTATVARNENKYNGYLQDSGYNALAYESVQYKAFPTGMDDTTCVLVTVG